MYILHIFRSISTLKENFFYFLILERIFTEQITNFNEECRENYRLQDHVFTTRNVSIGFCNLLSIIAFVFHYFPLFSREERIFHPLPSSLYLPLFFPRFFQSSESIKRNISIRAQRDSMLTRFLIVFLCSFVFSSFFLFFSKALSTIKGREELAHHRSLFSFPFKRRISKRSGSNRFVRFYFN